MVMTQPDLSRADPKGLIRESYQIAGISEDQCRSIFLDWALSLPEDLPVTRAAARLVMVYGTGADAHPMTALLYQALAGPPEPRPMRRGGAMGRRS